MSAFRYTCTCSVKQSSIFVQLSDTHTRLQVCGSNVQCQIRASVFAPARRGGPVL